MSFSLVRRFGSAVAGALRTLTVLSLCVAAAAAQPSGRFVTVATVDATRAELTHRLDSLQASTPTRESGEQRREREAEIAALRLRLTEGDFQTGDRFVMDDGVKIDTVVVRDSAQIALVNWPAYSLHGVLRSELKPAVEKYVGTYIREPRLRIYPLLRLSFTGGFGRNGIFTVDPSRPLSDAINLVGGVSNGKLDKVTVRRGDAEIMNEQRVADAMRDGVTPDALALQDGDELRAPVVKNRNFRTGNLQLLLFGISAFGALLALIRASYTP